MSNVTLEGIAEVIRIELEPIRTDIKAVQLELSDVHKIVNNQTTSLDTLLTEKKNRDDNKIVEVDRIGRLELWAKQVGNRLGITIEL